MWFFRLNHVTLQGCKWKHPNWRSHLLSPGPPRRSHPPRSALSWCNGRAQWERCLGGGNLVKFGDGRNPVITAWDIENPVSNGIKLPKQKLLHDFFHQQHFEGMTVLGRIVSLTEWRETTWNYSEGGMVPIHPSCIQQGIYWYPHPNSIPISPGTRAAKVVYTQVGASIKETVRGHSRQIELCSVTWWCRLATVVTGCEKRGGWDRLKKRRSWLKKSERLCIYI